MVCIFVRVRRTTFFVTITGYIYIVKTRIIKQKLRQVKFFPDAFGDLMCTLSPILPQIRFQTVFINKDWEKLFFCLGFALTFICFFCTGFLEALQFAYKSKCGLLLISILSLPSTIFPHFCPSPETFLPAKSFDHFLFLMKRTFAVLHYYRTLGFGNNADLQIIRSSFITKMRKFHPDKNPAEKKELCTEITKVNMPFYALFS